MNQILIIEDEPNQIKLYQHHLMHEVGVSFTYASDILEAKATILSKSFDLYILDLNLKGYSGIEIIKMLQQEKNLNNLNNRIIVVSSSRDEDMQIQCYHLGVANILTKPINYLVLKAIINKNLKAIEQYTSGIIKINDIEIDSSKNSCIQHLEDDTKRNIDLTPIEFKIFYQLARRPNIIASKEDLSLLGKDIHIPMSEKSIEMHISSIRKKFGNEKIILSKRGVGYYIES